jgi:predicted porin
MLSNRGRCIYYLLLSFAMFSCSNLYSQRYLTDIDSAFYFRDTLRPLVKRLENLRFSGYIQPQFQVAEHVGTQSFNGGNFPDQSSNRFMLRRARVKIDYLLPSNKQYFPRASFTFQVDATERGVIVRDMYIRLYQKQKQNLSLTVGLFARPFGYEVNLSSSFRESPERGRASQILMPGERDLGAMASYEQHNSNHKKLTLKLDAGVFNGQGPSGTTDFDSYKDFASRVSIKPLDLSKDLSISLGGSVLLGGWVQSTKYRYETREQSGKMLFVADSSLSNIGSKAPRRYYGADVQLFWKHGWGRTEIRAENWRGTQSGTSTALNSPGAIPLTPTYVRKFDAAFFYFIQSLFNENWEALVKYDWFDPNSDVKGMDIGSAGSNLTTGDIKFSTVGLGLTRYFTSNLKVIAYYDIVRNEKTALAAYANDIEDNIFTLRLQLKF